MPNAPAPNPGPVGDLESKLAGLKGEKGWAMSCYIPVFNIITCVLTSIKMVSSKFCLFHARQGFVLFLLWFLTIVVAVLSPMLSMMLWGVVLMLHVAGMVIAYGLKVTEIPIVSGFAAKIPDDFVFKLLTGKKLDGPSNPPNPKI
ncbi:hypothetical protein HZA40_05405 [Candidatus Peregrinibacteria bacterium]|nr:hypothetical protein [Candidatus Peregrinibacteria bacterium]